MGLPPVAAAEEPPPEELPGFCTQIVEMVARNMHGEYAWCLNINTGYHHAMPERPSDRDGESVPHQQRGHHEIERAPHHPGTLICAEVEAGRELVAERQGDGEIGVEVQVVPGLV